MDKEKLLEAVKIMCDQVKLLSNLSHKEGQNEETICKLTSEMGKLAREIGDLVYRLPSALTKDLGI